METAVSDSVVTETVASDTAATETAGSVTAAVDEPDRGFLSSPPVDTAEFPLLMRRVGNYGNHHRGDSMMHHHGDTMSDVERYIHMSRRTLFKHLPKSVRIKMKAKAAVRPQLARFQLVDRRDRVEKTLLESDWLPDERELSGQPFFLRPYCHVTNCLGVSRMAEPCRGRRVGGGGGREEGGGGVYFTLSGMSCHREGRCHMLFQLVRAEASSE